MALAAPPVELSVSGLGTGSRAVIDGAGDAFSTFVGLGDPGISVVETANGDWLVLDLCLHVGFEPAGPVLPEVSRRGAHTVLTLRPAPTSYAVTVRPNLRASDAVRVGPVGAPVEALQTASAFGTALDLDVPQGADLHHRVAVRVDGAAGRGLLEFPLIYRLETDPSPRTRLSTTHRRWR
ncbi:MAG: hypothetical protein R3F61_36000 [Myxococcota bacterium]